MTYNTNTNAAFETSSSLLPKFPSLEDSIDAGRPEQVNNNTTPIALKTIPNSSSQNATSSTLQTETSRVTDLKEQKFKGLMGFIMVGVFTILCVVAAIFCQPMALFLVLAILFGGSALTFGAFAIHAAIALKAEQKSVNNEENHPLTSF